MQKLFVSFGGLLNHLEAETVKEVELTEGLFYFGCQRGHVFDDIPVKTLKRGGDARLREYYWRELIIPALTLAEATNRATWHTYMPNYPQLNELLAANSYGWLTVNYSREEYIYSTVARLVQEQLSGLEVVY